MPKAHRAVVAIALVSGLVWSVGPGTGAAELNRQTLAAAADGVVSIEATTRALVVEGWPRSEVVCESPSGSEMQLARQADRVRIESLGDDRRAGELRVRVPAGTRLEVSTTSGSIEVRAVDGAVAVDTLSGAVLVAGRPREIFVETVSGPVTVQGGADRIQIETISGAVQLDGGVIRAVVEAVQSTISVRSSEPVERLELETVAGAVTAAVALADTARVDVESHAGAIDFQVPAATSARIGATTFAGTLVGDWQGAVDAPREPGGDHHRSVVLGSGSARVDLTTFAGRIRLTRGR